MRVLSQLYGAREAARFTQRAPQRHRPRLPTGEVCAPTLALHQGGADGATARRHRPHTSSPNAHVRRVVKAHRRISRSGASAPTRREVLTCAYKRATRLRMGGKRTGAFAPAPAQARRAGRINELCWFTGAPAQLARWILATARCTTLEDWRRELNPTMRRAASETMGGADGGTRRRRCPGVATMGPPSLHAATWNRPCMRAHARWTESGTNLAGRPAAVDTDRSRDGDPY